MLGFFCRGRNSQKLQLRMSMRNTSPARSYKWIREPVDSKEEGFNFTLGLSIYVVTWNLNSTSPKGADLSLLLSACESPPDIYAIGLQEMPTKNLVGPDLQNSEEWIKTILDGLHPDSKYSIVETVQMGTIMLVVAVRNRILASGILWSKATVSKAFYRSHGAVGVSLLLRSANICFVNAHFVPFRDRNEERQADYEQIHEMMNFQYMRSSRRIDEHDAIFFFGDLNYRLTTQVDQSIRFSMEDHWMTMLKYDQLQREMADGKVFHGYVESQIHFGPTYKFDVGTNGWDTSAKPLDPAWCDRILWRGNRVKPMAYQSVMNIQLSSHKPVYGMFHIQNDLVVPIKKGLSRVTLHQTMVSFPMIRFYEKYMETITMTNEHKVNVTVRLSLQQESKVFYDNWVKIEPSEVTIESGKSFNICLHIRVDSTNACVLQSKVGFGNMERVILGHVLVQQADEIDQRVSIYGSYLTSCFGHTMETLAQMTSKKSRPALISPWDPQPKAIKCTTEPLVPRVVTKLGRHLQEHGLLLPNLFADRNNQRTCRDHPDIKNIRHCLDSNLNGNLVADPRAVAEVFLMVLESSPTPLVDRFDIDLHCTKPINLKDIVSKMSTINRAVFLYVLQVIKSYISHRSYNKCDLGRLAIIFGPVLMKEHPSKIEKRRAGPIHDTYRTMFTAQILSLNFSQCFLD